jgi:hypothetical protein
MRETRRGDAQGRPDNIHVAEWMMCAHQ